MAEWYHRRFGVSLDPGSQVLPVLGAKEAIAHLPLALLNPGEVALTPDPGYPVYVTGAIMADGEPFPLPMRAETGWLPDFDAIPREIVTRARLLWLNYPNNPTGAAAPPDFYRRAIDFCRANRLSWADYPYSECGVPGYRRAKRPGVRGAAEEWRSSFLSFEDPST